MRKSLSLMHCMSVGVDRMQRNFAAMRRQAADCERSKLTDITAKVDDKSFRSSRHHAVPVRVTYATGVKEQRDDDLHTGLREIDAVARSDRETVDNRGRCDQAILDRHSFPGFAKTR